MSQHIDCNYQQKLETDTTWKSGGLIVISLLFSCFHTTLTQVSDAALSIPLYKDVSAFQVSVGDSRLFLGADNLGVEVDQATGHRQAHPQAALRLQAAVLQEVVERTQLMKVGDEPQLGAGILGCHVRGYET